jgi:dihydropyrimidinase
MFDTLITGGLAVLPQGCLEADIGIVGERIAQISERGRLAAIGAKRSIDAGGRIVIPGGIDTHTHCAWPLHLPGESTMRYSAPPAHVSRAALFGGTTTMLDFCMWQPGESVPAALARRDRDWVGACHTDWAYHVMVQGALQPQTLGELGEAIQDGHASVKIFTTDVTPARKGRMVPNGSIWEILKVTAKAGGLAVIHAEDNDLVMHMYEKLIREDRAAFENMAEVHSALSEDLSFNRVIGLAENVPGAAIFMMHISARQGVEAVQRSRARGFPVYGETLQLYLLATEQDYRREGGQMYHTYPSLKTPADQAALWAATRGGAVQCIGTDGICCPREQKTRGLRVDDTTGGNVSIEPRLALMYTQMVTQRGYSLEEFVALVSTNAARVMGLYPRKGVLAPGSDADIVLLEPGPRRLTASMLHESDYTPWEGVEVTAWPSLTMLRGKVMVEGETFHGLPGDGRWQPRRIADDIRRGPAL